MTREDAERKIRSVFTNYFQFAGDREADEVIEALKQKPSYQLVSHNDNDEAKSVLFDMLGKGIYVKDTKENRAILVALRALEQEPCGKDINVPATDAISRQAVLNILDDMVKDYIKENDFDKAQGVAWVKVQKLPPVNPQDPKEIYNKGFADGQKALAEHLKLCKEENRWIPVSERLPEIRQHVLCQCRGNLYSVLRLNYDSDWECIYPHTTYMQSFVIAWMPLPKPYKEESEETE